ncbi:hypothetical protein BDY19DRAFT_423122 [Irpex rosettiformis]|uniref:Uncharacterized protein n=1 Tax=Irpex rosettiformis TaxID=378272 RepID=A0ACB8UGH9_9APHY|nr:hypothetical protein BDY19DRAFT_423122 [Irpex rosettiformis]
MERAIRLYRTEQRSSVFLFLPQHNKMDSSPELDFKATPLGALLMGGLISTFLSGIVTMQAYIYARNYPTDRPLVKVLAGSTWLLDIFHSTMVATSLWLYLIDGFGSKSVHDKIFWSLGVTVASTAILTFFVHAFFCNRLHKLSKGNFFLTVPIAFVALFRLVAACVTTAEMIRLQSFSMFMAQFRWVFTLGLALSSVADVLIASGMCFFLRQNRTGTSDLDRIIDSVIYYTIENGLLTSIATILSLVFWLATPHNLVYMGLHFAISKLYANSLLASLNARKSLRQAHSSIRDVHRPSLGQGFPPNVRRLSNFTARSDCYQTGTRLEINVEKTIDCIVEEDGPYTPGTAYQMGERSYISGESTNPHKDSMWMPT